jgi:hypothetical protein
MRAKLRSLESFDVDDLEHWTPPEGGWSIGLRAMVGPDDDIGEESFDFALCNPTWLASRTVEERFVSGRHTYFTDSFDWAAVHEFVRKRVETCEGASWPEVAEKLSRLAHWEFEDYTPTQPQP